MARYLGRRPQEFELERYNARQNGSRDGGSRNEQTGTGNFANRDNKIKIVKVYVNNNYNSPGYNRVCSDSDSDSESEDEEEEEDSEEDSDSDSDSNCYQSDDDPYCRGDRFARGGGRRIEHGPGFGLPGLNGTMAWGRGQIVSRGWGPVAGAHGWGPVAGAYGWGPGRGHGPGPGPRGWAGPLGRRGERGPCW